MKGDILIFNMRYCSLLFTKKLQRYGMINRPSLDQPLYLDISRYLDIFHLDTGYLNISVSMYLSLLYKRQIAFWSFIIFANLMIKPRHYHFVQSETLCVWVCTLCMWCIWGKVGFHGGKQREGEKSFSRSQIFISHWAPAPNPATTFPYHRFVRGKQLLHNSHRDCQWWAFMDVAIFWYPWQKQSHNNRGWFRWVNQIVPGSRMGQ